MILILLDNLIIVYVKLTLINIWDSRFESPLPGLSEFLQVAEDLASKTILKIYWRPSLVYFSTYGVAGSARRLGGVEAGVEAGAKGPGSLSLLSIDKKFLNGVNESMETRFL